MKNGHDKAATFDPRQATFAEAWPLSRGLRLIPRAAAYRDPPQPPQEPPLTDFIRTKKGEIRPLFSNVVHLLHQQPEKWALAFDAFAQRPVCRGHYLSDSDGRAIAEWAQNAGVHAAMPIIQDAILRAAEARTVHPIRDYLRGLTWDKIPRLDMFLIDHAGAYDDEHGLTRAFCRRWMIQAVARVLEPGCHARATLILEGPQDIGKSTILRDLFGARYFTDHLPDLTNKDALLQLRGSWCIEIAELASLNKQDAAKIKAFLSARVDKMRDPYGRMTSDIPRQTVFAGTVNPGARGYLKDETGATRFWPVPIRGPVDIAAITDSRDQLWAEAFHRYAAGEPWWLDPAQDSTLSAAAMDSQAERFEGDGWDSKIAVYVEGLQEVTLPEVFQGALDIPHAADWDQGRQNRIARALGAMGWTRKQKRAGGLRRWIYLPPGSPIE